MFKRRGHYLESGVGELLPGAIENSSSEDINSAVKRATKFAAQEVLMPLTLRPTGLGSGIEKNRPDYTVYCGG